ncbi:MAG: CHASE3 domain-containing protein [Burkholderiaceae bacterium]|nr:CHASE3 domain-containing protein [Burkholderiaceae bacterium]
MIPTPSWPPAAAPPQERLAGLGRRLRSSPLALSLAVLAAGAMLVFSELGYRESTSQLERLTRHGQVRVDLWQLRHLMSKAESSQRGYVLTGRSEYLDPYRQVATTVGEQLAALQANYGQRADEEGQTQLRRLGKLIDDRFNEMQVVIDLHDQGKQESALLIIQLDRGRDLMSAIERQTELMTQREDQLIRQGLGSVTETLQLNRVGIASLSLVSLLMLGLYLRQRRANDQQRAERQRLIQDQRDQLEQQVQLRTAELVELTRHLETAREDERARLARELHDELGALLTAAKLDVARMRPTLQSALPELTPRLVHLVETLNSGIALKRRIIEDLRPSTLSNLGLKAALEILCSEFAERSGLRVSTDIEDLPLTPSAELTLFRLVQEALTNVGKYAQARQVEVRLMIEDSDAQLLVRDDGVGFDAQRVGIKRHGLTGMRYRVEAENGRLRVQSAPGLGTRIEAWLPLAASATEAGADPAAGLDGPDAPATAQ